MQLQAVNGHRRSTWRKDVTGKVRLTTWRGSASLHNKALERRILRTDVFKWPNCHNNHHIVDPISYHHRTNASPRHQGVHQNYKTKQIFGSDRSRSVALQCTMSKLAYRRESVGLILFYFTGNRTRHDPPGLASHHTVVCCDSSKTGILREATAQLQRPPSCVCG